MQRELGARLMQVELLRSETQRSTGRAAEGDGLHPEDPAIEPARFVDAPDRQDE